MWRVFLWHHYANSLLWRQYANNFFCGTTMQIVFLWHHYANFGLDNPERWLCKDIRWPSLTKSNVTMQTCKIQHYIIAIDAVSSEKEDLVWTPNCRSNVASCWTLQLNLCTKLNLQNYAVDGCCTVQNFAKPGLAQLCTQINLRCIQRPAWRVIAHTSIFAQSVLRHCNHMHIQPPNLSVS